MAFREDVTIGPCRLILGDMREVLPLLDQKANMCLSDPPYRITSGGNTTGEMGGCFAKGVYDNSGELFDLVEWSEMAPLIFDALDDDADAVVMCSDREEAKARVSFLEAGFSFHRLLAWDKVTATPNRWYMPNLEFGLYLYKGRARRISDCSSKALIRCPIRDVSHLYHGDKVPVGQRFAHPTEKPVALMSYWMRNSTNIGDLVLEPFMGAGATMVAAVQEGRQAVGVEKDPKWFEVACNRVREAVNRAQTEMSLVAPHSANQEGLGI